MAGEEAGWEAGWPRPPRCVYGKELRKVYKPAGADNASSPSTKRHLNLDFEIISIHISGEAFPLATMSFHAATISIFAWLLACTLAAPASPSWNDDQGCSSPCMSAQDAHHAALNFQLLITDYSDTLAESVLAPNFIDYSDSVTELINSGCEGPQPVRQPSIA